MSVLLSLTFIFGCLTFENQYSIDRDGDGFSIYDGDCDDNDINITLAECTDDDNDGQNEYEGDCDDTNPFVYTGIAHQDDPNKDLCMKDVDGDGFGDQDAPEGIINGSDCDDNRDNVNTTSNEICDELDNDCDELVDEEPVDGSIFYEDQDGDGFGSNNVSLSVKMCVEQAGYVSDNTDCDDGNPLVNTEGTEVCDEKDNDCDGLIDGEDEDVDVTTGNIFYVDSDGDGFGDRNDTAYTCKLYDGLVDNLDDCDDENEDISPNGIEICDGIDNDCDNKIDDNDTVVGGEGSGLSMFYRDVDNDGYGNEDLMIERCIGIDGYVNDNTDCDDTKFNVNLGRNEVCDEIDNDCDGLVDDSDDSVTETTTFYRDVDGDGFGNGEITEEKCVSSEGFVEDSADCEDENAEIHPDASEVCDEIDNDCDELIDDDDNSVDVSVGGVPFYFDFDGDGVGVEDISEVRCSSKDRFVAEYGDCDDSEETVFVGAEELCDGLNNDCSDNGDLTSLPFDEMDDDGDGFVECEIVEWKGSTTPLGGGDCDDEDPLTFVGSAEFDSETLCMRDVDGDGFGDETSSIGVESGSDCDDENASIYPNAEEICDGLKNDCLSEQMSNEELDLDGDGFVVCGGSDWVGSEIGFDDCDDGDDSIYPNAEELCDGVVTDCRSQWHGTENVRYIERDQDGDGAVACEIVASGWLGDGNPISGDCDDNDPLSTAKEFDADCDGITTDNDCDDNNALDKDCDGVNFDLDCDDNNVELGSIQADSDCDGIITENDCNEENPNDQDCDGISVNLDCDDNDASLNSIEFDGDCDGFFFRTLDSSNVLVCGIIQDHSIICWGDEISFHLNGSFTDVSVAQYDVCGVDNNGSISCTTHLFEQHSPANEDFIAVDSNDYQTCGIKSNGSIECLKAMGTTGIVSAPYGAFSQLSLPSHINHKCGIKLDSSLECWGADELPDTAPQDPTRPIIGRFQTYSLGYYHSCGVKSSGMVLCGGKNNYGQSIAPSGYFSDVSVGQYHSCGLRIDGSVDCWGIDDGSVYDYGQSSPPSDSFRQISSGKHNTCGITAEGSARCWGSISRGYGLEQDFDEDGVHVSMDCNDHSALLGSRQEDQDCDGILFEEDCDDSNPYKISIEIDENCDGWYCEEGFESPNNDIDCDGIINDEDCDDVDPYSTYLQVDQDCDGIRDTIPDLYDGGWNHTCIVKDNQYIDCWGDNTFGQSSPPNDLFVSVGTGIRYSCGLQSDGTIECWGDNTYGQLNTPHGIFVGLTVGGYNSCALNMNGEVQCWGSTYTPPNGLFEKLNTGVGNHKCGIKSDGSVQCWGANANNENNVPDEIYIDISTGYNHICGLKSDKTVVCWGDNAHGQLNAPTGDFEKIHSGAYHTCGLRGNGTIECWGPSWYGVLNAPNLNFTDLFTGDHHNCGILENGEIICWGWNDYGQSNTDIDDDGFSIIKDCDDTNEESTTLNTDFDCDGIITEEDCNDNDPSIVQTLISGCDENSNAVYCDEDDTNCLTERRIISGGGNHTCRINTDDSVVCWGQSDYGQSSPPSGPLAQISAGSYHTCGINSESEVKCWGWNEYGQVTDTPSDSFDQISTGGGHTCGIKSDGYVTCWGNDTYGQASPPSGPLAQISSGFIHTCGIKSDGSVECWGSDQYGQSSPPNGSFVQISAGGSHNCGIKTDGSVECWGRDNYGQSSPPNSSFTQISAGSSHTCGINSENEVKCWGWNEYGQSIRDNDNDGVNNIFDCDDFNSIRYEQGEDDLDCDGVISTEDCDDENERMPNFDADCDGSPTNVDCDDNNPDITQFNYIDTDCNGSFPDQSITFDGYTLCVRNDINEVLCRGFNPTVESFANAITDFDHEGNTLCVLEDNDRLTCSIYGEIILSNEFPEATQIFVLSDAAYVNHNNHLQCVELRYRSSCYEPFGQINDLVVVENYLCGMDSDMFTCFDKNGELSNINDDELLHTLREKYNGKLSEPTESNMHIVAFEKDDDLESYCAINQKGQIICPNSNNTDLDTLDIAVDCELTEVASFPLQYDYDCDGIPEEDDCDDKNTLSKETHPNDNDCDGILNYEDCDDNDPRMPNFDQDCDGLSRFLECDDIDSEVTSLRKNDSDCDGVNHTMDCDDGDSQIGSRLYNPTCQKIERSLCNNPTFQNMSHPILRTSICESDINVTVDASYAHTCILRPNASVACFGFDYWGQSSPPDDLFTDISVGELHTCGIKLDKTLTCWGRNSVGQSSPPAGTYKSIVSDRETSCAIDEEGYVHCWGRSYDIKSNIPNHRFKDITIARRDVCGIRLDDSISCWGQSFSQPNYFEPHPMLNHYKFASIYSNGDAGIFCGVVALDNTVRCWNLHYQNLSFSNAFPRVYDLSIGNIYPPCYVQDDLSINCLSFGGLGIDVSMKVQERHCMISLNGHVRCSDMGGHVDQDSDGWNILYDCDDNDPTSSSILDQFMCDGISNSERCENYSVDSTTIHNDYDCDGILNYEDCDPYNGNDDDCDGLNNEEDLYPNNPYICFLPNDMDCDGFDINEDCDDSDVRYGSIEDDTDCDGLSNDVDPDPNFADGDLDGIPYDEDCDDKMSNASQYDGNGNCTLAICLNENNEEVLTEGLAKTDIIYGEATITPTSYEGWEQHQFAEGLSYGERNCYLDWDISGIPNVNPNGCEDCIFTFELTRTPNPFGNERVPSNVDMNDGTCSFFETWQESPPPFSYGYAEDYNGYGPALFYDGGDGFYPWIVPSQTEYPDESSLLYDETTGHFSYSIGFEDYLYSPCEIQE